MRSGLFVGISASALVAASAQAQDATSSAQAQAASPSAAQGTTTAPPVGPSPSSGASLPSQDVAAPPETGIKDIIVTAQKRSERLQDVPISIVAVSGDRLAATGVASLDSFQRLAPGLVISSVGSGWVSYTYLRGAGTNQSDPGADQSVAYYLDEVYLGEKAGLQFDLLDVDRVEVLKGPQGTLFGRNAEAGAISVTSKRPSDTFGGTLDAEYGNYNAYLVRASITGPIGGGWDYRASFGARHHDGYTKNLYPGNGDGLEPSEVNSYAGRVSLQYRGDPFYFLLTGEVLHANNGQTNQFINTANKSAYLSPTATANLLTAGEDFYAHYYNVSGYEHQDNRSVVARGEYDFGFATLTSLSSYRFSRFNRLQDQDGSSANAFTYLTKEKTQEESQELRLASNGGGPFKWIGGLYYYHSSVYASFNPQTGPDFAAPALQNLSRIDQYHITVNSYAAFGQITYSFTSKLALTLGGRYTKDDKSDFRTVIAPVGYTVDPSASWHSFDPAVTLNYKLNPDILLYASAKQGFKSGGFQTLLPATAQIAATPFLPEKARSYEIGVKSTFLDRRLIFNADLFRTDITNQQISRNITPTQPFIDNAGSTRADGIDVDISLLPLPNLHLNADMTFMHARFRRFSNPPYDFAGNDQIRSPDFQGSFSAAYDFDLGHVGMLTLSGDYSRRSDTYFDNYNTHVSGFYQPAYGIANARLTLVPRNSAFQISAYVRNLGDVHYFKNILVTGTPGITALSVPGDPRTYGVALDFKF